MMRNITRAFFALITAIALLVLPVVSATASTSDTTSHQYINAATQQGLIVQVYHGDSKNQTTGMVGLADKDFVNSTFEGMTVDLVQTLPPDLLKAWTADAGKFMHGTFTTDDGSCISCESLIFIVSKGNQFYMTILIDLDSEPTDADAQTLADYTSELVKKENKGVKPPEGFTLNAMS